MTTGTPGTKNNLSTRTHMIWCIMQMLFWAAGMFIWCALLVKPSLGLHLLWNILIPLAPVLLVVAPGVWRNVCPLGSMSLAPHRSGLSLRKRLSPVWRSRLYLGAFILLIVVVPMRKVILDTNGPILAVILAAVGLLAIGMGLVFDQKSGWCSSLCPVYPVELLYGSQPLVSVPNVHCPHCSQCVQPCSESTAGLTPKSAVDTRLGRSVGVVLTGFFPGFVWGWYNVSTYSGWEEISHLHLAYGIPYTAGSLTLVLYLILCRLWSPQRVRISRVFAASAIMTYYWFRLPPMFGIGDPNLAMVDISDWLPPWTATALRVSVLVVFSWLMAVRTGRRRAWEKRPSDAEEYTPLQLLERTHG